MRFVYRSLALLGVLSWSIPALAQHHHGGHNYSGYGAYGGHYNSGYQYQGGYYGGPTSYGSGWSGISGGSHHYAPFHSFSSPSQGYPRPSYGVGFYGTGARGFSTGWGGHHHQHH